MLRKDANADHTVLNKINATFINEGVDSKFMRLYITDSNRMVVKLAKNNHSNALQIYDAGAEKAESYTGVRSLRTLGTILFGRLSLLMEVPTLKSSYLLTMEIVPPNEPGQTHS